jgi:predicted Zn-dependent peptidase
MELPVIVLSNGIRVVHHAIPGKVSHCGIFINAGTRDETPAEHGLAHFIEHVIFKGTEKRNVFQVLNRLENVGADLNAYTTKEETCIYASFLNPYYDRTLELISDICFHSTFPAKEINKEKDVVIDEIKSYQDNPSEQIFDDFEDMVFSGHPLGRNILGTPGHVRKFKPEDIRKFVLRNYHTDQIVICSVGNIEWKKFLHLVQKYFSGVPSNFRKNGRLPFSGYQPEHRSHKRKIFQTHCITGAPGYSFKDEKRYVLAFLNNILGGPILNSRLAIALREKNGITYHIESNYVSYSDTGIVSIYFGTDKQWLEKALKLVDKELEKLRTKKLGVTQLHTAKTQLIGQLALAQESKLNQMLSIGKSFLVLNKYLSIEEIIPRIEEITSSQLMETANEVLLPENLSSLIYHSTH